MKTILCVVCGFLFATSVQAQLFSNKIQDPAEVNRVYLWDIPKTDKIYNIQSGDTVRVVVMYTVHGTAVYVLTPSKAYQEIKSFFASAVFTKNISQGSVGEEFVVSYFGRLSWLKRRDIKLLAPSDQLVAKALNEKEKYTMLMQAPKIVVGKRNHDGNIIPDFSQKVTFEVKN